MVIGLLTVDIHFPHCRSLKEKRKELNSLKDRIRRKYEVALAELEYQDSWQRTRIGVVTLNSKPSVVEQMLARIREDVIENTNGQVLSAEIQYW
jgi:uncharacterized protein YlxP (DUF503 family)